MIIIENLTKKYKSKNRRICTALDSVNLTLPDTGMVFIIGKSGSGKSTLLNMIGGLDGFDGGKIISDGNDLSSFSNRDFYKYRASYVGFVFQDFHLIEELTVEENVRLEAEIANTENPDIKKSLADVDLEEYGARYPDELSGGQKQRVAIARALIKSPRVILCDEPTGNLDNKTSAQIMDLLSQISKNRLVLIVSHNIPDAEKYADRIIELSAGKIISDVTRRDGYVNILSNEEGILTLPHGRNLSNAEAEWVFKEIKDGRARSLRQNDSGYEQTAIQKTEGKKAEINSSSMKFKTVARLFACFSGVGKLRTATTALISAIMLTLLVIFQSFLSFDSGKAILESIGEGENSTIILRKDTYSDSYGNTTTTKLYSISSDDLAKIDEISGEATEKYLLYSYAIPVNLSNRPSIVEHENIYSHNFVSQHIYTPQMPGVLVCNEDYLEEKFGTDGTLSVIAGDISLSNNSAGVIITDYLADAMLIYNPLLFKSYDDVINASFADDANHVWGSVIAIVDTGYKTQYADVIELIKNNDDKNSARIDTVDKDIALKLIDDIKNNLSIGYSINPEFLSEAVKEESKNYARLSGYTLSAGLKEVITETGTMVSENYAGAKLEDGEIYLTQAELKLLFPEITDSSYSFPFTLDVSKYEFPNNNGEILYHKTFTVKGISKYVTLSENDFVEFKKSDIVPYAVYVQNFTNADIIIDEMEERYFSWNTTDGTAITLLNRSVNMFFDLFRLIEMLMLAMTVIFIVSHGIRSIKNNYYQIGVIKAIGGRSGDISKIFVAQNALLSLIISLLTYIGARIFVDVANDILITSFTAITKAEIQNISIISFTSSLVITAIALTFVISLLATVAPLIMLTRVKPINIIKAKE